MKFPRVRTIILVPLGLFALFYLTGVILVQQDDRTVAPLASSVNSQQTVAIFGASGTAGDGILKAAMADPGTDKIHVITRRATPRIEAGVASGKVQMTQHMDYLDYAAIHEQIEQVDAVYWAIGLSAVGLDEETYGMIHVDFPTQFVREWLGVSEKRGMSFHYISSSDISADSSMMWAREKVRAENTLFDIAENTNLRVIAYRPDYIGPTEEEAHLGQDILYWFFAPVGAAVRATQIGQAMLEVTARESEFEHRSRLATRKIIRYSDAYDHRQK
ncbi:MAG: hypothetical protein GWP62_14750 [Gammaproteobacteria bacterium]|jgi:hypothetical protein|nr:hypothetical protein [Gammaproteobacteria bacterium]